MKAIVQERYGSTDDLVLRDVDQPTIKDDEVLVRVRAASVHPDVWHVVTGLPYALRLMGSGLRRPKSTIPGTDVAGEVAEAGKGVTQFRPGDEVFGESLSGHQWKNGGTYAEFVAVRADRLALKPVNLTFEQAAAVPTSGLIALACVRGQGAVQAGQRVLVNGAAGGVGLFVVQLAKAYGAEVTGVDATSKQDLMRSIGADHVTDYTQQDFTRSGVRYDLIVDIPGNRSPADCRRALTAQGTYVLVGHDGFGMSAGRWFGSMGRFLRLLMMTPFVSQRMSPRTTVKTPDPLLVLKGFLESGAITPVIDRTFPLAEAPAALRYLADGQAQGKVIMTV